MSDSTDGMMKAIRSLYLTLNGKAGDITLSYRGTDYGTIPWLVRMDNREAAGNTSDAAMNVLYAQLKEELVQKVSFAQAETNRLKQALNQLRE